MMTRTFTESWQYPKEKSLLFTGHRPEKLGSLCRESLEIPKITDDFLEREIQTAIDDGIKMFYDGLARGIDLWAARKVLEFREKYADISLVGVQPYPEHGKTFREPFGSMFREVCDEADIVLCTGDFYHNGTYLARDRFMVDRSSRLIGVWDSTQKNSGTAYTIRYAQKSGLKCSLLDVSECNKSL